MSKYAKNLDLSVAVISLISLALNFTFPHMAIAKEITDRKALVFDFTQKINTASIPIAAKVPQEKIPKLPIESKKIATKVNYKPAAVVAKIESTDNASLMSYVPVAGDFKVTGTKRLFATAYSSTPDQTDSSPFITASNKFVRDGIIAANFLPFGTKVRIPSIFSDKIFVVEDRMNVKHNDKIDVWFSTRQEAINFGIKYLEIEILAMN